jgi:biopolymer transport protein ExbD
MRFTNAKRRQPPAVIIISLIDVLIVMLIFLMVTTTFKQQPALKLNLPESKQPKQGVSENNLVVTLSKEPPYFYLGPRPVTLEKLREELFAGAKKNPNLTLSLAADTDSTSGKLLNVMEAAKDAGVTLLLHTKEPKSP